MVDEFSDDEDETQGAFDIYSPLRNRVFTGYVSNHSFLDVTYTQTTPTTHSTTFADGTTISSRLPEPIALEKDANELRVAIAELQEKASNEIHELKGIIGMLLDEIQLMPNGEAFRDAHARFARLLQKDDE